MKYCLLGLFMVFCLLPLCAQLPQSGNWFFEIVGTEGTIDVEINGTHWDFELGSGIKSRQVVTIDPDRKSVVIPIFSGYADDFVYVENVDYIDFFRGDTFNLNLYDLMVEEVSELRAFYGVSRNFADTILEDLRRSFMRAPLLRLRPIR